jgi:hypothetical protein
MWSASAGEPSANRVAARKSDLRFTGWIQSLKKLAACASQKSAASQVHNECPQWVEIGPSSTAKADCRFAFAKFFRGLLGTHQVGLSIQIRRHIAQGLLRGFVARGMGQLATQRRTLRNPSDSADILYATYVRGQVLSLGLWFATHLFARPVIG